MNKILKEVKDENMNEVNFIASLLMDILQENMDERNLSREEALTSLSLSMAYIVASRWEDNEINPRLLHDMCEMNVQYTLSMLATRELGVQ